MKIISKSRAISFILTFGLIVSNFMGLGITKLAYAGTGTSDDPFTVAEAILIQDGTIKTVKGYIVGQPTGDKAVLFSGFTGDTAIALADTSGETDTTKMIYVQLGTTPSYLRTEYGLKTNPSKMGTLVKVTGNLTPYFTPHSGLKSTTAIEPVNNTAIPVNSISLDKSNLSLGIGASETLTPIFDPTNATNKKVIWASSDETVAKVTSGLVEALKVGTTVITVTTDDGSKTATCDVIVTSQTHVTGVSLDQDAVTLNVGKKITLTPTIEPSDATVKTVTWTSSDDTVAKVTAGLVEALKEGAATITVTTDDGNFTDTCAVTVPPIPKLSIADARIRDIGEYVTVCGIVTHIDKPSSGSNWNYYIQDDTAAIDMYITSSLFDVGDKVTATGPLSEYYGLREISPKAASDVIIDSHGNPLPAPKVITIPQANSDTYESQLVKIENATLGTINTSGNTPITNSSSNSINIYKIPALTGITTGDTVNVTAILSQRTSYQLLVGAASNIVKVDVPDTTPPVITHTAVTSGNTGKDLEIKATITDNKAVSAAKVYYRTKGDIVYKDVSLDPTTNPNEYSAKIPKADLSVRGLQYYIEATDGTNTTTFPADVSAPIEVAISAEDILPPEVTELTPASGTYTDEVLKPVISAKYSDVSGINTSSVMLTLDGVNVTSNANVTAQGISYTPDADLTKGKHIVSLTVADNALTPQTAVVTWNFYVGALEYNFYFGQLHSHTTNSDGKGTLDEAFNYAKNAPQVDFLAVTDHSNSLESTATANINDGSSSTKWLAGRTAADKYTDNSFVGIYAYEMTWSNGTGHMNTFNTEGFENRANSKYTAPDGLNQYYNALKTSPDSITQFNHPGPTFGDFNDFANYDPQIDKLITMIEVGNGEGAVRGSGYFPSYDYYTRALDKGWHVSPTNNQDNHLGKWGDSNTARTVVLTDSLTRDSIYDAMRNMRTYATEDNNLRIKYTLNGEMMGTILDQKPSEVNIKVDLEDPDNEALRKVSVISNGGNVVASKTLTTSKDTVEFTLAPSQSYYYIRVDEADEDIAVTAPVWIGDVDKAGISKTTGSTTLPMKGESFKITTSLFNNETVPMNINSLVYSINGTVINTAPVLDPINSLGTGSYSFDFIPLNVGKYNIDVKLTATINGVEKIFTDVLKLEVVDPAIVTKVIVDASHYNDYVSGYYSGNMANLITLANSENINVIIQKDKLTDDVLKDTQLLVLSSPAKKEGTVASVSYPASPYTQDEIAVIQRYVNSGGNIIINALADYQDNRYDTTNHSAYQQNLILAAIGASTRINDDEVVDYDNNPNANNTKAGGTYGTPYRVPMNVYNMDSPYLNGVVPEQNYSFYSGCSITMGGNATWIVKGTPTTYGFDSDNDKLGGSFVSSAASTIPDETGSIGKGNVIALALETLPGGGKLFVGGTVFYSNFEVKAQLDNASQLQNSNYNIVMNILDSVKRVIPVTQISTVRSAQKGDVYCVEGTVTAGKTPADNAFFDTLYIQDSTGGINLFPVSGTDIRVGQKVKAIGTVDEYLGDKELRVIEYSVTDTAINPLQPTIVSTKDAMDSKNGGMLIKIEGIVTNMDSGNIYVDDGSGDARAFVDGYIGDGSGDSSREGKWDPMIQVGDKVNIIGLASVDPVGPRLRVRNTTEIVRIKDTVSPIITIKGVAEGGVYNTDVTPVVTTNEGTLTMTLNGNTYGGETITAEDIYILLAIAEDRDGNKTSQPISFTIDKMAPTITVNGISDKEAVKLNQKVAVTWSASDVTSGVETSSGDVVSGEAIATSKVGVNTLNFTATDKAGNKAVVSITYYVQYVYSGVLKPLNNDGSNVNKLGSTVPVKFQLKDVNGAHIANAEAKLYIALITNGIVGTEFEGTSTSNASGGKDSNIFRSDGSAGRYIFNLNTKNLTAGTYQIRIDLGDGTTNTVNITLR